MNLKFTMLPTLAVIVLLACAHVEGPMTMNTGLPGNSTLRGCVYDYGGNPIAGATLTMQGPSLSGVRAIRTDADGYYVLYQLPSGPDYSLSVSAPGYITYVRSSMRLVAFRTITLSIALNDGRLGDPLCAALPRLDYTDVGGSTVYMPDANSGEPRAK